MIRELATKRLGSPPRNHLRIDTTILSKGIPRKRETHDALKPAFDEEDSEIEISGPFPLSLKPESNETVPRAGLKRAVVQKANAKPIHPFFRLHIPQHPSSNGPSHFTLRTASSAPAAQLRVEPTAPLNDIATNQNVAPAAAAASGSSRKLNSVNTFLTSNDLKNFVPGAQINPQFPIYSYKRYSPLPTVVYTQHEEEANDLIAGLKPGPVAFDMEWRFFFVERGIAASKRMVERRAAVVQIADSNGFILVIQIYDMNRFPIELQSLIENPDIPKIGVNILNDGKKLFRDYGVLAQNLVELGALALLADPAGSKERSTSKRKIISLVKLVQWYCGMEVEKGDERVSNWEWKLSRRQIDYAANDVHSSMEVYQKLCDIAELNAIDLVDNKSTFTVDVTLPSSEKYLNWSPSSGGSNKTSGQSLRAYHFWHHNEMTLDNMCKELSLRKREFGLKPATVITYIISALKADASLPYSLPKLIKLVQTDIESWTCHREWIVYVWNQNLVTE